MSRLEALEPQFVETIPRDPVDGRLYISIAYATALHLCCCGCGSEVVTPIHPTRWTLSYHGDTVSLHPSVGSWSLPCRSHYVITRNRVRWAPRWSHEKVQAGREQERFAAERYFSSHDHEEATASGPLGPTGLLRRILRRFTS